MTEQQFLGSILIAFLTSVGTAWITSLFYGRKVMADLRKEFEGRVNAEKWRVYTGFIDWLGRFPFLEDVSTGQQSADLMHHIDLTMLLGSDEVVNAVLEYWKAGEDPTSTHFHPGTIWPLLNAMRKDLGYNEVDFSGWLELAAKERG